MLASGTKVIGTGRAEYGKVAVKRLLLVLVLLLPSTAKADLDGAWDIVVTQPESDYDPADPAASVESSLEPSAEPLPPCTAASTDVSSCSCTPDATAPVCIGADPSAPEDGLQ